VTEPDDDNVEPIELWKKALGWLVIVLINLFFGFYVCLFGLRQGPATTNSWLASLITSTVQDPILNIPLAILWYNVFLPLHIRHKVKLALDSASSAPYRFATFIPTGPASRVALKHPEWASSKIAERILRPEAEAEKKPEKGYTYDVAAGVALRDKFVKHLQDHEATAVSSFLLCSFAFLTVFLLLVRPRYRHVAIWVRVGL
jgi:hypothetical protein